MYGIKWLLLSVTVVIVDQVSKTWAVQHLLGSLPVVVIPGYFDFSLVYNRGAAFGFLNNADGWQNAFFVGVGALISLYLIVSMYRLERSEVQVAIAYALIIGGAAGNVIDRLQQGYVIDFIHWFYRDWHWPTFNVADAAISVGAVLLVMDVLGLRVFSKKQIDRD